MNKFTNADEVFAYLEGFTNLERGGFNPREYRLERMERLLRDFGDPHRAYEVIHVAGSKGKGSVSAMAASCCAAAGARVGLYMSPHVSDYRERIGLLGKDPTALAARRDGLVVQCGNRLAHHIAGMGGKEPIETLPTTFELLTLLAFLVFREAGCEIAVVEVGLGGRLDATNLVSPAVTVITPIELEHTDYLGGTLALVAREKGGIIKPGVPIILADQHEEARNVLVAMASERKAPHTFARKAVALTIVRTTDSGTDVVLEFSGGLHVESRLRMLGRVQADNAIAAGLAARVVIPTISAAELATGLNRTWLPGRAELLPGPPRVLLDGAHTPASIRMVMDLVAELEPDRRKRALVFGSVSGKQHESMLRILVDQFPTIIISRPGTFKTSNTEELLEVCVGLGGNCSKYEDMREALARARETVDGSPPGLVVVTGSFHLIGAARRVLEAEAGNGTGD